MYVFVFLFLAAVLVAYLRRLFHFKKWDHLPGPKAITSVPLVGHAYKLGGTPLEVLNEHQKQFGDVFRLDEANFPTVWLCDYNDIAETFKREIANDRPYHMMPAMGLSRGVDSRGFLSGPLFSSGRAWNEQRKFMFAQMSNLGMGRTDTMDEVIAQESDVLAERMARTAKEQGSIKVINTFRTAVFNVVWRIITGKRTRQTDPQMEKLTVAIWNFFDVIERGSVLSLLQNNSWTISKLSNLFGVENLVSICRPMLDMIESECKEYGADKEGNFIERYKARIAEAEEGSTFHKEDGYIHLLGSVFDIFAAGTDTVSTFLEWAVHYMISYPDVQEKCVQEIDSVIGHRAATLSDRNETYYCEAVIQEMMRHSPHMALTLSHLSSEEIEVKGLRLPKGTQIFGYHGAVHKSPKTFGPDPEVFRPERFIDEETRQFKFSDHILYFGVGNRRCVGEILARAEQYLFFVTLVQRFKFRAKDGIKPEFKYHHGLNQHPLDFEAVVEPRF